MPHKVFSETTCSNINSLVVKIIFKLLKKLSKFFSLLTITIQPKSNYFWNFKTVCLWPPITYLFMYNQAAVKKILHDGVYQEDKVMLNNKNKKVIQNKLKYSMKNSREVPRMPHEDPRRIIQPYGGEYF